MNRLNDHYCELLEKQMPSNKQIRDLLDKPYFSYDLCVERLQKGIPAVKFSFNNPRNCKPVTIKLSKDRKQLIYFKQFHSSDFFAKYFKFARAFKISKMSGFTYGPTVYTFQMLRKRMNLRAEQFRRSEMECEYESRRFDLPYNPDYSRKSFEEIEEQRENQEKFRAIAEVFQPWDCVSLHINNSTVDFAVKDKQDMFALLHVLHHTVNFMECQEKKDICIRPFL